MDDQDLFVDSRDVLSVYQVFTPTTQAKVNFVPRRAVNSQLVDALRTPGMQIVVYGESGSGKSSLLLRKLHELYPGHITTRCNEKTTYDHLLLDAFDQLDEYYIESTATNRSRSVTAGLVADFTRIRASVESSRSAAEGESSRRVLPPQLTAQRLGQFLGAQGLCWVIEDFHKVAPDEKRPLAQSLKVFSDLSSEFSDVKIIAIGATETAREVVEYDPEMRRRVAEVLVPLMTDVELTEILENGQRLLNVSFASLSDQVVRFSMGVASVCHQLALNACLARDIMVTQESTVFLEKQDLNEAAKTYVRNSSDTLKATFDLALRRDRVRQYDNCRLILIALARGPLIGMLYAEILADIRREHPEYPAGNLTNYLRQLRSDARGNLLRLGADGRYRFAEPLHHTYAQVTLLEPERQPARREELQQILYSEFWKLSDLGGFVVSASNVAPLDPSSFTAYWSSGTVVTPPPSQEAPDVSDDDRPREVSDE